MASSSKKPKDENKKKKKKDKSNRTAPKETKKPEKKASSPQKSNKPKAKPDNKRKRKEKIEENGGVEGEEATVCRFPMNRIKRIIKSEDSSLAISQDVVFLVNKATEMFLEKFSKDGYKCSVKDRKKSLSYKHLATVAHERKRYDFLSDYVPQKIKAEDALKEMNSTETWEG
ncbi:hypothetical protein HRI_002585400 [Hibiscus trionum]|uniref:Transcription factor CBF/NF-Y/archaeal histone domain-containing protein n=1 Tax=Hibiscus trionum TaxID=183268 RepID=A0A9W7I597_HIBTR|nr:hypothetical protein HRI_002585400 [Hibiscus trionum]